MGCAISCCQQEYKKPNIREFDEVSVSYVPDSDTIHQASCSEPTRMNLKQIRQAKIDYTVRTCSTLTDVHSNLCILANRARSFHNPPDVSVTIHGSTRDGTSFCNVPGDSFDVDFMYKIQTFSEEEQLKCLRYLEDRPGFLYIEVYENISLNNKLNPARYKTKEGNYILSPEIVKQRQRGNIDYVLEELSVENNNQSAIYTQKCAPGTSGTLEIKHSDKLVTNVDAVQCIACIGWPKVAHEWSLRERHWPLKRTVKEVINSCFHVVPEAPLVEPDALLWMLSFSLAEAKLVENLNKVQLTTYLILKKVIKENKKDIDPCDVLTTYHLKTILFWACEKIPASLWVPEKLQLHINTIIIDFLKALDEGNLPNYFIPDQNLFHGYPKEDMNVVWQKIAINLHKKLDVTIYKIENMIDAGMLCKYGIIQMAKQTALVECIEKQLCESMDPEADLNSMREFPSSLVAGQLSDMASIVCEAYKLNLISSSQFYTIETVLSFACGIIRSMFVNIDRASDMPDELEYFMSDPDLPEDLKQISLEESENSLESDVLNKPTLQRDPDYPHGFHVSMFRDNKEPKSKIIFDFETINSWDMAINIIPRILSTRIEDFLVSVLHTRETCDAEVCIQGIIEEIQEPKFAEVGLNSQFEPISIYDLTKSDNWFSDLNKELDLSAEWTSLDDKAQDALLSLYGSTNLEKPIHMIQMKYGKSLCSYVEGSPIIYPDILKLLMEEDDGSVSTEKNCEQFSSLSRTHLYSPLLPYELWNKEENNFVTHASVQHNVLRIYNDLHLSEDKEDVLIVSGTTLDGMGYLLNSEDCNIVRYMKIVATFPKERQRSYVSYIPHKPGYVNIDPEIYKTIVNGSKFVVHDEYCSDTLTHAYITPCIACEGWPTIAAMWPYRKRANAWPPVDLVHELMKYGFYLLPVNPENLQSSEWRLTFTQAEAQIIQNLTRVQLTVYQIIMQMFAEYIQEAEFPLDIILKHHLFWKFEKQESNVWTTDRISEVVADVLDTFIAALKKETLPHYFIPEQNLLQGLPWNILNLTLEKATEFRKNSRLIPLQCLKITTPWEGGKLCQYGLIQLTMQKNQQRRIDKYERCSPDHDSYCQFLTDMMLKSLIDQISLNVIITCDAKKNEMLSKAQVRIIEPVMNFAYCTVKEISSKLETSKLSSKPTIKITDMKMYKLCYILSWKLESILSAVVCRKLDSAKLLFSEMKKSVESSPLDITSNFSNYTVEKLAVPAMWLWYKNDLLVGDGNIASSSTHFERALQKVVPDLYDGHKNHNVYFIQLQCNDRLATFVEGSRMFYPNLLRLFMEEPNNQECDYLPEIEDSTPKVETKLYPHNTDVTRLAEIPPGGHYLTEKYSDCISLFRCMATYVPLFSQ